MCKWILLFVGVFALSQSVGWANGNDVEDSDRTFLKGGISYSEGDVELPPELFGTWQRTRTLLESNLPQSFDSFETGYWTIEKNEDHLTLTNPENGASTTIHLQSVQGKTAKFEYFSKLSDGTPCREELTLSAGEDSLRGTQKKVCSAGKVNRVYAVATVSGYRLDRGAPLW